MKAQGAVTGQDWLWVIIVAVIATVATFGGFLIFLPAYVLSLLIGYIAVRQFRKFFDRSKRSIFVLKVLAVVLPAFAVLSLIELALLPSA